MEYKNVQDLIKLVSKLELSELKLQEGDFSITIRSKEYTAASNATVIAAPAMAPAAMPAMPAAAPAQAPAAQATPAAEAAAPASASKDVGDEANDKYITIKSPMVGTFYRRPSPDKDAFVKVGESIQPGDVLCMVEAMKLFNEIEAEQSGKIVKVYLDDASPVEYDQPLFLIDPS